jgi:predicted metal-binding membrane protein
MGDMAMHAGGAMSMWTRMPGQSWPGFAASFIGMWMTMMVPMMIPPFAVMLWRYRTAARRQGATRLGMASVMVTLGYFAVWSAIGVTLCPLAAILLRRTDAGAAWRDGVRLALHCVRSCAPLMAIAFVVGGTDYRVMAAVTAAITVLRLAPASLRDRMRIGGSRALDEAASMRVSLSAWTHRRFAPSSTTSSSSPVRCRRPPTSPPISPSAERTLFAR